METEHFDKQIRYLKNSFEGNRKPEKTLQDEELPDVQMFQVKIGDENIAFTDGIYLDKQLKLRLPKSFKEMDKEEAAMRYPFERRPPIILSEETGTINFTINHTQNEVGGDMGSITQYMEALLKKMNPSARIFSTGTTTVPDKEIGFIEFRTDAYDDKIYNLVYFAILDGRMLICTFNCLKEQMDDWQPVAKAIMLATGIKETKEKG